MRNIIEKTTKKALEQWAEQKREILVAAYKECYRDSILFYSVSHNSFSLGLRTGNGYQSEKNYYNVDIVADIYKFNAEFNCLDLYNQWLDNCKSELETNGVIFEDKTEEEIVEILSENYEDIDYSEYVETWVANGDNDYESDAIEEEIKKYVTSFFAKSKDDLDY